MSFPSMRVFYASVAFLVLGVLLVSLANAYTLNGSCVYQETAYYKVEQCPAVINDLTNYVNLSITNKHSQPHNIMLGFGFDTDVIKPKQAWRWGNAPHQVPTYGWVSHSYTCVGEFNYSLEPKYFWCYDYNGTKKFEHSFVNGWPQNSTAEWFEWEVTGAETQWWNDWIDVSSVFTKQNFQGKTWYYTPQNISFAAHETKVLRALIQAKPNTQGKYDLFAWRGEWTPEEAWGDSSKSVLLDPWWDNNWDYRKAITGNDNYGVGEYYQEPVTINVTGLTLSTDNCSKELRVTLNYTAETEAPVSVLDNSGEGYAAGTQYCVIQFLLNASAVGNASYAPLNDTAAWVYYKNAGAGDPAYNPLPAWDFRFQGNATPTNDGWAQIGANVPSYSQVYNVSGTTNGVWLANDTGGNPDASWYRITGASVDQTFTSEARILVHSNSSDAYAVFGARQLGDMDCVVQVQTDRAGVGDGVSHAFFNYALLDGTAFHTYRAVCDGNGNHYTLFVDGVNTTWGSNASTPATTGYYTGEVYADWNDQLKHELDYGFIERNRTVEPLGLVLGAQENPASTYTLNVSVFFANGTAISNWNINLTNATASFQYLNQNNPLALLDSQTPNQTTTVCVWKDGFAPYTNNSVEISAGSYTVNLTVYLYPYQYFYFNDTSGAGLIETWSLSLWNGTDYYNETTTNYLVNVSVDNLPLGSINSTANSTGYVTNTSSFTLTNSSMFNITFNTYAPWFAVTCLDADTGAALASCGIRVENSSVFNSSVGDYNKSVRFTPTGSLTVTANKTGFASSIYYASWDGSSNYNVNAYLMNLSNPYAIYVRFHVRNVYNIPLENAFVNITRMVGGSPVVVGQCYTDAAGDCAFYLSSVASYTIVTSLSGYYSNTVSITPSSNDYTITLTSSAVSGNYTLTNIFEDLRWGLFPNPRGLTNLTTNFSLIAVSDNCSLAYWGFNLSCNGSLITLQNTSAAGCGGTLYYFANLTNCNGTEVTANYWFSRNPFILGEAIFSWYLDAAEVEKTFTQWREDYADSGAGTIVFAIIALLVALFVGAWVARVNRAGAVLAIIAVLALASAANWLGDYGWVILTFTVIFVGAALFLRERVA